MNRVIPVNFEKSGSTITVNVSDSSQRSAATTPKTEDGTLMIYNTSPSIVCWIEIGDSSVDAVVGTSFPLPPGSQMALLVGNSRTHFAAVCDTGQGTTIYATPGLGR